MNMIPDFILEEGIKKFDLVVNDKVLPLLNRYVDEIELFNPAYGLVKVSSREELIIKHILDSLAPHGIIRDLLNNMQLSGKLAAEAPLNEPPNLSVADVGSGAGLPGIPLAVCMPDAEFTLIERMGRRAGFLQNTLALLGLHNARVMEAEMEALGQNPETAGSFNMLVFRAFKPLEPALLKNLFKLLVSGGVLAAYKGRRESIEQEMAALQKASGTEAAKGAVYTHEIIPLEVPLLNEERHLLVIRKQ